MPAREHLGISHWSCKATLAVGLGGLLALTLLMDYAAEYSPTSRSDPTRSTVRLDDCPRWQPGTSQTLAVFIKAVEGGPAVIEHCFRAGERADARAALRERRKAAIAANTQSE